MSRNLFVLSTPSQAFFLSQTPHLINEATLVLTVKTKVQADRIMEYLRNYDWDAVYTVFLPKKEKLVEYWKIIYFRLWLLRFKFRFSSFDSVFMGSYINPYHISIVGEYEADSKIFLLYDGMQTIAVSQNRRLNRDGLQLFPEVFQKLGFKRAKIRSLNYVGPLPVEVSEDDSYEQFSGMVSFQHPVLEKNVVYFVGQPLVGLGIVTKEFYLGKLEAVRKRYFDKNIVYVPHPREKEKNLKEVRKKFEVKRFSGLFEEEFINSQNFAGTVISFYSSTIMNLCYLQAKIDLLVIDIPSKEFLRKDYWESISLGYDFMKKIDYPYLSFFEKASKSQEK